MRVPLAALLLAAILTLVFWAGAAAGRKEEQALRARAIEPLAGLEDSVERALSIPDAGARATALAAALERASAADIAGVFRTLDRTNLPIDTGSFLIVFDWAASYNPVATMWQARPLLTQRAADAALPAVVRRWARLDPATARAAIDEIYDPRGGGALWDALVMGWAEREGDTEVWRFLEAMEMGAQRQRLIQNLIARKMHIEGIDATLAYVESIPDDARQRFKLQAFRRTARVLAREDPERAVLWARAHAESEHGDGVLRKVATSRVVLEGGPGIAWLTDVPAGAQRDDAMVEAYRRWLRADGAEALKWLPQAPQHPAYDQAWALWVGAKARRAPHEAKDALSRIHDQDLRDEVGLRLGRIWMNRDREAGLRWVEQSDLPEEYKQFIRDAAAKAEAEPADA